MYSAMYSAYELFICYCKVGNVMVLSASYFKKVLRKVHYLSACMKLLSEKLTSQ